MLQYYLSSIVGLSTKTGHFCVLALHRCDKSEIIYLSTTKGERQCLHTTRLNMIKSFLVHPAATFSTRSIFQRNAVVLVLTFALTCAVFLTTHQILASAPTSSRTDEHHEVKVWSL